MKKLAFVFAAALSFAAIPFVCPAVEVSEVDPPEEFTVADYEPTIEDVWFDEEGNYHPFSELPSEKEEAAEEEFVEPQAAPDCVAVPPELVSTVPGNPWKTPFGEALAVAYGFTPDADLATKKKIVADINEEFDLQLDFCFMCGELTFDQTQNLPLCKVCHDMLETEVCKIHEETQLDCGCWKE